MRNQRARLSRADFSRLSRAKDRRVHGEHVSLHVFRPEEGEGESKFTCVVSKKVAPTAVERNRIKRRCREAARACLNERDAPGVFVLYAKRSAASVSFSKLRNEIAEMIQKSEA